MGPYKGYLLGLLLWSISQGGMADPLLSNVRAVQREGSKLVDVHYDLTVTNPPVAVTVQFSTNGGATYALTASSLVGDVGGGVSPGVDRHIVWDVGTDWDGRLSPMVSIQVTIETVPPGFARIPAGTFEMGDSFAEGLSNELPVREAYVAAFYMQATEVTKAQWDDVRNWGLTNGYTDLPIGGGKAPDHPVHTVAWTDILKWCNARSEKEGLGPCYWAFGAILRTGSWSWDTECFWGSSGYRLPTETEWEKTARGGAEGHRFPWSDTDAIGHSRANYSASTNYSYDVSATLGFHPGFDQDPTPYTSPAGYFAPNGYGAYDMAGNVMEWCWDGGSSYRMIRGGSWLDAAYNCRVTYRRDLMESLGGTTLGFRAARKAGDMVSAQSAVLVVDTRGEGFKPQVGDYALLPTFTAGSRPSAAIKVDGTLWVWGEWRGQDTATPLRQGTATTWVSAAAGDDHVIAVRGDGSMWAWGDNDDGQLGLGDNEDRSTPVRVGTASNWVVVATPNYEDYSVAIRSDGSLWSWGANFSGQLGLGHYSSTNRPAYVLPGSHWIAVAAGDEYAVALRSDRTLWAWGGNGHGQLGTGNSQTTNVPVLVSADTNWTAISAGAGHCLALRSDGSLWSWGQNTWGELGLGDTSHRSNPTQVGQETNWVAISAGAFFSLALRDDGSLWSWGNNGFGQLGHGDLNTRRVPSRVGTGTNWVALSAGDKHSLALRDDGTLWSCGDNYDWQLGQGTAVGLFATNFAAVAGSGWRISTSRPLTDRFIRVSGDLDFGRAAVGHTVNRVLTIHNDGTKPLTVTAIEHSHAAFSGDSSGVIQPGEAIDVTVHFTPADVGEFAGALSVISDATAGIGVVLATGSGRPTAGDALDAPSLPWTDTGDAAWFGDASGARYGADSARSGDIGDGQTTSLGTTVTGPCQIRFWWRASSEEGRDFLQFYIDGVLCAEISGTVDWHQLVFDLLDGAHALEWRYRKDQTGRSGEDAGWIDAFEWISAAPPVLPVGGRCLGAGSGWSAAVSAGSLYTWGRNDAGQLGTGDSQSRTVPGRIPPGTNWLSVAVGGEHTMALRSDGSLWGSGNNSWGQLGLGHHDPTNAPAPLIPGVGWSAVVAGSGHSIALRTDGTLWSWGLNDWGQLGLGNATVRTTVPNRIGDDTNWIAIASGPGHSAGLRADGSLWTWGSGECGELGLGDWASTNAPARVGSGTNWASVAAGEGFTLGLKSDGTLWAWGLNDRGRLGVGFGDGQNAPTQVGNESNWTAVAAGLAAHALAIRSDGSLWAWGDNGRGQLGLGDRIDRHVPTTVDGMTNCVAIAIGAGHSLALRRDGTLWVAGANPESVLGTVDCDDPIHVFRRVLIAPLKTPHTQTPTGRAIDISGNLVFDKVEVGVGATRRFAIFNDGTEPLTVGSISHASPAFAGAFAGLIPPASWVSADVTFAPTSGETIVGVLRANSDADSGTDTIPESGRGIPTLADALDGPRLTWGHAGPAAWAGDFSGSHDGTDVGRFSLLAGEIDESLLWTEVTGPGELRFWWRLRSSRPLERLSLSLDGSERASILADDTWQHVSVRVPEGRHTLHWSYLPHDVTDGGEAGFLDEVRWIPDGSFAQWQERYFSQEEIADPEVADFGADPDCDGLGNGIEAVLGTSPRDASGPEGVDAAPRAGLESYDGLRHLTLRFTLAQPVLKGARLLVQASGTLRAEDWTTILERDESGDWWGSANFDYTALPDDRIDFVVLEPLEFWVEESGGGVVLYPQPFFEQARRFLRLVIEHVEQ